MYSFLAMICYISVTNCFYLALQALHTLSCRLFALIVVYWSCFLVVDIAHLVVVVALIHVDSPRALHNAVASLLSWCLWNVFLLFFVVFII